MKQFPGCKVELPMDRAQGNAGLGENPPGAMWGKLNSMDIERDTSPETAIKTAYDFGRGLRVKEAQVSAFPELLTTHVTQPFAETNLLPYVMAGFTAGFYFEALPWRRQIEAQAATSKAST